MVGYLARLCGAIGLFVASTVYADLLPATWTGLFANVNLRTAYTSSPWFDTSLYGHSTRTTTLAAAVSRCWSRSGQQLSEDYCLGEALNVAFVSTLTNLCPQHNTTAIGARDMRSTSSTERSLRDRFEVVDLEFNGDTYHPRLESGVHNRRSEMQNTPANIRYSGALPQAFLYRRKGGNHSREDGADRPIFVATDGFQKEIAHLQQASVGTRGDASSETELIYEAGHGIKVQSRSRPVTTAEYVQDWMNSDSGLGDSTSMSDYLVSVAKSLGYLGFELKNGEAGRDGKLIMVAESLGFGREWESNWNWCFATEDTAACAS